MKILPLWMQSLGFFMIICGLAVHGKALAENVAADALIESLQKMPYFEANFTQLTQDNHGTTVQDIQGQMRVAKSQHSPTQGLFYWRIDNPFRQVLVVRENKLWIIDHDLEQVTVDQLSDQWGMTPAVLFSGDANKISSFYQITYEKLSNQGRRFVLVPKEEEAAFKALSVEFGEHGLEAMDFTDNLGQRTAIDFDNIETSKILTEESFQVDIPETYDVIDDLS